jgi:hypothetical protein
MGKGVGKYVSFGQSDSIHFDLKTAQAENSSMMSSSKSIQDVLNSWLTRYFLGYVVFAPQGRGWQ